MPDEREDHIGASVDLHSGWRLTGTTHAWRVEQYMPASKSRPAHWEPITWHSTLIGALRSYLERRLRTSKAKTPAELQAVFDSEAGLLSPTERVGVAIALLAQVGEVSPKKARRKRQEPFPGTISPDPVPG